MFLVGCVNLRFVVSTCFNFFSGFQVVFKCLRSLGVVLGCSCCFHRFQNSLGGMRWSLVLWCETRDECTITRSLARVRHKLHNNITTLITLHNGFEWFELFGLFRLFQLFTFLQFVFVRLCLFLVVLGSSSCLGRSGFLFFNIVSVRCRLFLVVSGCFFFFFCKNVWSAKVDFRGSN